MTKLAFTAQDLSSNGSAQEERTDYDDAGSGDDGPMLPPRRLNGHGKTWPQAVSIGPESFPSPSPTSPISIPVTPTPPPPGGGGGLSAPPVHTVTVARCATHPPLSPMHTTDTHTHMHTRTRTHRGTHMHTRTRTRTHVPGSTRGQAMLDPGGPSFSTVAVA
jgi:hypothetical protein